MSEVPLNPVDVRIAAMNLLARREHGSEELSRKLSRRFGRSPDVLTIITDVLEKLIEEGLLSDERYAASLVRQLILRGLGPRRLDQELRAKGIRQAWEVCADSAELSVDWFVQAEEVYEKKFGHHPWPDDRDQQKKEWARRARFMQYRGFEPDHFMTRIQSDAEKGKNPDCYD